MTFRPNVPDPWKRLPDRLAFARQGAATHLPIYTRTARYPFKIPGVGSEIERKLRNLSIAPAPRAGPCLESLQPLIIFGRVAACCQEQDVITTLSRLLEALGWQLRAWW